MDIKKILTIGASAAMLSMVAACSDEPENKSPSGPSGDVSSSAVETQPGASSSSTGSGLLSSSSLSDSDPTQMACSEIMFNAADGSSLEWVEVYIAGGKGLDKMTNYQLHLSGDVDYTFPAEPLAKGEYVVVTNDTTAFRAAYPTFAGRLFGNMTGKLVNEGGSVNVKIAGEGDVTCSFSGEPPWPSLADGKGHTLVYTGGIAAQSTSWCASAISGGNPGVGNDACVDVVNTVRINEVKPTTSEVSWIELYNSGTTDVDVSGWTVKVKLRKDSMKINAGAVVPAGGYLLLDGAADFDKEVVIANKQGGEIYLYGSVPGQESSIWLQAGETACGIIDVGDGSIAQGPMATETPGAKNSQLKLGSVYISEIHYHPKNDDSYSYEFLELVNLTAAPLTLYNTTVAKGWKVEGINIEFAANDVIPANGVMLLVADTVSNDTAFIRTKHKIPNTVPIKAYKGKLSNRGEAVVVKEPYSKSVSTSTTGASETKYFYTWHDATLYSDAWAGLTKADGAGYSLQRKDVTTMGYSPSAWIEAVPTPGVK
ncbi:MAG: lamin tail domain-containing protein [Fibrobacter sp.]|nr:lamin tail domain-containing protein [Fibrobacter sp.]